VFYLPPHGRRPVRGDPGLTVVLEKAEIVDRGFDAQDKAEFVIELERNRPHGVLDTRAFYADIETIAHLALVAGVQFAAQKSGDVVRLDSVDRGAAEILIHGLQIGSMAEHDVGGILTLVHAPVIVHAQTAMDGREATGELIQLAMQLLDARTVGDPLRSFPVGNTGEGVVQQGEADTLPAQPCRHPVVPVEVDLQPTGQPCWYPYIAQPQFLIDEVEVVVQAFAVVGLQEGLARLLVVPRLIGRARFHGREDVHHPRSLATHGQHLLHPVLFAEVPLANELDFQTVLDCQSLGVLPQLVAKRLNETGIVEEAHFALVKVGGHPGGETNLW